MQLKKNNINRYLSLFLITHLIVWTLVPAVTNNNLPLDTIEALAWGSNLDWGFNKHPPLSAFFIEIFYQIFGNQDWAYYFLSQIFVVSSFFIVWIFSKEFFEDLTFRLVSILLLEGIYFYNFTTPEFNVNVCQLPFWTLSVLYAWKGFKDNKNLDWLLFGFFAALGVLSKYLFIYLLAAIDVFFCYMIIKRKFKFNSLISLIPFFLVLIPHLIWLVENDYITISYALHRTGATNQNFLDHFLYPLIFLTKQLGILIPFIGMFLFLLSKIKIKFKFNFKDKKLLFLLCVNIVPIILMFLTSFTMGVKIRTMWMTPFYLFFGVMFVYYFQKKINLIKFNKFLTVFLTLFFLSPIIYGFISISQTDKRTDYPGKEIAIKVEEKWKNKFTSKIKYVIGDEWTAGNLSYHLSARPRWLGTKDDVKSKDKLSIVDVYENNVSEAVSKIGYFKIYGDK